MKINSSGIWRLVPVCISMTAAGCSTYETYKLNEVSLSGPIARTPINVTIDPVPGTIQVIPGFALDNGPVIKGSIDPSPGTQSVKTPASSSSENLTWNVPSSEYSLDLQFTVTQHFGLTAGGVYASVGGNQFTNFRGGVSFFNVENNLAIRLDAGVQFNGVHYRSRATVTDVVDVGFQSPRTYVTNFDDTGTEQSLGVALGLTLNSAYSESFVNAFLHVGVAWQPLIDYYPTNLDTVTGPGDSHSAVGSLKSTTAVLSFGGGLAIELGKGDRALIGVRGAQILDINAPAPGPVWQPFVEFVLSF